jgi:hypothetical protein
MTTEYRRPTRPARGQGCRSGRDAFGEPVSANPAAGTGPAGSVPPLASGPVLGRVSLREVIATIAIAAGFCALLTWGARSSREVDWTLAVCATLLCPPILLRWHAGWAIWPGSVRKEVIFALDLTCVTVSVVVFSILYTYIFQRRFEGPW